MTCCPNHAFNAGFNNTFGRGFHSRQHWRGSCWTICPVLEKVVGRTEWPNGLRYLDTSWVIRRNGFLTSCNPLARSVGVDADDTAKTLLALSLLGQPAPHQGLLDEFEGETHFITYKGERNPSFTANCNVLVALLSQPNVSTLTPQITKVASFLSREWWESNGAIDDKWVCLFLALSLFPFNTKTDFIVLLESLRVLPLNAHGGGVLQPSPSLGAGRPLCHPHQSH